MTTLLYKVSPEKAQFESYSRKCTGPEIWAKMIYPKKSQNSTNLQAKLPKTLYNKVEGHKIWNNSSNRVMIKKHTDCEQFER